MVIESHPATTAFATKAKNVRARWPTRGPQGARFFPVTFPSFVPSFQLRPTDRVFCLGSCFAREIEAVLARLGHDVLSLPVAEPTLPRATRFVPPNKYAVASLYNEVRHALLPEADDLRRFILEIPDGTAADYQLAGAHRTGTRDAVEQWRRLADDSFRRIKDADLIIITLGLSEVWFDRETGLYLNQAPSRLLVKSFPRRFELRVLDVAETATQLTAVIDLLTQHLKPTHRILLTVSPIPLIATFRNCDVTLANAYSKAVLRCATEQVIPTRKGIEYFPSYEMTTLSDPLFVWSDADFRHLNRDFVTLITCHALDGLIPAESRRHCLEQTQAHARLLLRAGRFQLCLALLDEALAAQNSSQHGSAVRELRRQAIAASRATPHSTPLWRQLEQRITSLLLNDRQIRKYRRDRNAFFEDSSHPLARWYWRLHR